ncbi:MAG: hypothetical protein HDT25_00800 [Ruminococcus sp.]|nr:hypothetical protein [Ruminococcus sp.]
MTYDEFLNYALSLDRPLFLENENNISLLEKLCSIADKKEIHYLWSNYKSPKFISQKKLSCRQNEYHNAIKEIFTEDKYLIAIDSYCFDDNDKHVILQLSRNDLTDILTHFYWELDEVYIFNDDLDWFIAINHHFDMIFYCCENSKWLNYYSDKIKLQ